MGFFRSQRGVRHTGARFLFLVIVAPLLLAAGCSRSKDTPPPPAAKVVTVSVDKPRPATLHRAVRQPGTIEAYEHTPIYPKIAGFVEKWNVDIGDNVSAGKLLAELYIPEMVEELKQKEEIVKQARESLELAKARVATAAAWIQEARAALPRAQANHQRWQLEYDRISKLIAAVIDKQVQDETRNQLLSAGAGVKEAEAKIDSALAAYKESEAARSKAQVDIGVADADRRRMAALVSYASLTAPFKGVVTRRHINTGDFVQPPSAGQGEPLFVVERRDLMRIFVEVPETEAPWVAKEAKASVRIQALQGKEFPGNVTRISYALDRTTRTLLAEIDLENPKDELRPGMYAYATISADQKCKLTLPVSAVVTHGDVTQGYQTYCYVVEDGKARRTFIEVGARDSKRIEVLKKRTAGPEGQTPWVEINGEEAIIQSNISGLTDGQTVQVAEKK